MVPSRVTHRTRRRAPYPGRMAESARDPLEGEVRDDAAAAEDPGHPVHRWMRRRREELEHRPRLRVLYRSIVAVIGVLVVVVGIALIPLPGPGWLVVFFGLAILGTEFHWAKRLTGFAKRSLARFWAWVRTRRSRDAAPASPRAETHRS